MATDVSDIIKQGYLRVKSKTVGVWQKRWIVLRRSSSKGPCRLDKYLDEKNARNAHHHKTLLLSNVLNISRLSIHSRKHSFVINFNDIHCKFFACESGTLIFHLTNFLTFILIQFILSLTRFCFHFFLLSLITPFICKPLDLEADVWVKLLIQECLVPQPDLTTGEPDLLSPGIQKELQEQFHVYLMPTAKLDLFGECLLQVTHENIYLWDVLNPKVRLVAWPLTALRRYGSDPNKFTFEAGR